MRRLPTLVLLLALAALAGPGPALAADCPGGDVRPAMDNVPQIAQTTLCLINAERAAEGLSPVAEQAQLTKASVDFSALMVSEHFFAHVSPDGSELTDRLTASGYLGHPGSWMVGENIAWGEAYLATPANIVKAWMNSPPHRANILKGEYEEIGLGVVVGTPSTTNPGATYTTDFGRRQVEDAPASAAKGDLTVGDTPGSAQAAPRANGKRSTPQPTRLTTSRRAAKRPAASCRRVSRRSAARLGATRRGRCVGAWRAVHSRL